MSLYEFVETWSTHKENLTEVLLLIRKPAYSNYNIIVEFNFVFIYYLCVSACKYALTCMCKSKDNLKDCSLLLPSRFWELNSGHQAKQQTLSLYFLKEIAVCI